MTADDTDPTHGGVDRCCRDAGQHHCHGTYLQHSGVAECTDPDCLVPPEAHEHRVGCIDAGLSCGCAGELLPAIG